MKQTTLWHRTSPTAVAPLLEMPVLKELDTWYTKCCKLYQVLNRVEKKNGQQLQLHFNVLWKNEFKAKAEETFEQFKKEVEEEIKNYSNSPFKFRPAPPLRSYFLPLCSPLRPSWDAFPRLNETDDAHYLCSQVRLICEMALESLEATIFSVDAKAIVRCGPDIPAVSEKNKVKEFSPCTRAAKPKHDGKWEGGIHLPDHTWAPELTIHPFGILRVEGNMGIEFDKLNRPRYDVCCRHATNG